MNAAPACWLLLSVGSLGALTLSCSGGSDAAPASAGAPNGGSASAESGASFGGAQAGGTGNNAGTAGQASVDCSAVCGQVKVLCVDNGAIDDVWLSACKSACDARAQLTPDVAQLEQTCVTAAADCNASVVCVASPH